MFVKVHSYHLQRGQFHQKMHLIRRCAIGVASGWDCLHVHRAHLYRNVRVQEMMLNIKHSTKDFCQRTLPPSMERSEYETQERLRLGQFNQR